MLLDFPTHSHPKWYNKAKRVFCHFLLNNSRFYIKCLKLCYTLRGGVVILYATVRAAVAARTHCRLCSLRRSANKVIVTYLHCVAV